VTVVYAALAGVGVGAVVLLVVWWYGRAREGLGEERALRGQAEGNARKRRRVYEILANRSSRAGADRKRQRMLDERDRSG